MARVEAGSKAAAAQGGKGMGSENSKNLGLLALVHFIQY
ncbi:hypothetical protein F383_06736 [Gossypium arboreum]|uniref:Uncharacterized protein n=1 Tax=Gossypium arboreum TaxID=29729 RepID=A0A0B0NHU8_GOSAR|nr:hypothetical protein F383_06736 [Gossypium arboreum]